MGDQAFLSCTGLTSVAIPNSVTMTGDKVFMWCTGLTSVEIPNSVIAIGASAFNGCKGLTSVEIPNSVTSIGGYAFSGCDALASVVIPNSVTSIGDCAFEGCSALTSVKFNAIKCMFMGGYDFSPVFKDCSALTDVTIGDHVELIPEYAFLGISGLNSVIIPNSVSLISNRAFANLTEVWTTWENPAGIEISADAFSSVHKTTLYVPIGTTENYKYRSPWNNFKEILEYVPGGNGGEEKCEAPVISIEDGRLVFTSTTLNAKYYYTIDCDDEHTLANSDNGIVDLAGTYQISVYAYAEGYDNSEIETATLVWVNPQIEGAGIVSMEAKKAVLIKSVGDHIQICGTELGETIHLYSLDGKLLSTTKAAEDETIIPFNLHKGEIYIIQYGDKSIKYKF